MSDKKVVFETPWFSIEREKYDHIKSLEGKPFFRIVCPDSVVAVALTLEKKIILISQFRPSINEDATTLPGGYIDDHETKEVAASRELYEETGYRCSKLVFVGSGRAGERASNLVHVFCGFDAEKDASFHPEEEIETFEVSLREFKEMALSGKISSLPAIAAVILVKWKFNLDDSFF